VPDRGRFARRSGRRGLGGQPAAADAKDDCSQPMLTKLSYLNIQQLLNEADEICRAIETGKASSEVEPMVTEDLDVSVPTARDILFAAIAYQRC
jgi:hypothetical protein